MADSFAKHLTQQAGERELAAELERVHQHVGRKFVGERGDGGVVVRRLARGSGRRPRRAASRARSAGSSGSREARQVGVAGRAEQSRAAPRQRKQLPPNRAARRACACYLPPHVDCSAARRRSRPRARTTSRELVEQALARIADPAGEGARAFIKVYADSARAEADFADRLRKAGVRRSPVDGLPVSLKDLFDVAGEVTRAGSRILDRHRRRSTTRPPWRACAPPARCSSAAPTWSSSPSAASASIRTTARRRIPGTARRAACPAARPPARRWRRPTACA